MSTSPLPSIQLSQAHLQSLSYCPRKFQYIFLDQLAMPQLPAIAERQQLGAQFHQLIQQQSLNLDIQPLLQENAQLQQWFEIFRKNPPPMITGEHLHEHSLRLPFAGFVLIAVYDLIIQGETDLQIIDWKTHQTKPQPKLLAQQWQSKLYPFLLAESKHYPPDRISMTYWFTEQVTTKKQNWITLPYSTAEHEATRRELESLLSPFRAWLDAYKSQQKDFPQVEDLHNHCFSPQGQCPFIYHCQRNPQDAAWTRLTDIEAIAEIPL
jgi:hypothetical protein